MTSLERISECKYRIPKSGAMNVDGIVFVNEKLKRLLDKDESLTQVKNVATLPGILKASLAMPDIHWGYGFPIGGVAAFDIDEGVVSPGGVGYDISCGVRLLKTNLTVDDIKPMLENLTALLFQEIPSGVGSHHKDTKLSKNDLDGVLSEGAAWTVKKGFGTRDDLERIEDGGTFPGANSEAVSKRAKERGQNQLGTLGSGNHFIEVGFVSRVFDEPTADAFGLHENQVTVFVHSGSRGLGYQVCDDSIRILQKSFPKFGFKIPDRQLVCAPIKSAEAKQYLGSMAAGANFGLANRQMIAHYVREVFEKVFGRSWEKLGLELLYDVSHNIAKFEDHTIDGKKKRVLVHRKGATRAFPKGHAAVPDIYRDVGQPVIIPGDMGRYSYILAGTEKAMDETFGSTCHGAGRVMSRHAAKRAARGRNIERELAEKGIVLFGASRGTIVEEMPEAYKDVADVVDCVAKAGLSKIIAEIKPMGVVKG